MPEPDPEVIQWYIAGGFNNWAEGMTELTGEKVDSLTADINLKSDSIVYFKLVRVITQGEKKDTTWYGLDGDDYMRNRHSTGFWFFEGQNNVKLQPSDIGTYTFIVDPTHMDNGALIPVVSVIIPVKMVQLTLILADGVWPTNGIPEPKTAPARNRATATSDFKVAAWYWYDDTSEGAWAYWAIEDPEGHFSLAVPADADKVIFVKFPLSTVTPDWAGITDKEKIYAGDIQDTYTFIVKDNKGYWANHEYGIMINGTTFVAGDDNSAVAGYLEFIVNDVTLTAGQNFILYDNTIGGGWTTSLFDAGSYEFTITDGKYVVSETAKYTIVMKLYGAGSDKLYVTKQAATDIDNLLNAVEPVKVIENGAMYIYINGRKYNVQGKLVY
jgi:hypothetical protein